MKQSLKNSLSLLVACIIPCIVIAAPNTTVQQYLGDISVVNNALPTGGVA
jgi:hypothetical protein